jgi:peptidyl-prolyl cis-trans isomerase NIMA-interacting 1
MRIEWTLLIVVLAGCSNATDPLLTPPPRVNSPTPRAVAQPVPPAQRPAVEPAPAPPRPMPLPTPPAENAQQIRASHVLVMYRGSERAPPDVSRSKDEARARAQEVLGRARRGEDFAALARQFSDEPGAGPRGGDLGRFGRGRMVAPFEQAAFGLSVNQVSNIVETPFGYHVIKRTE